MKSQPKQPLTEKSEPKKYFLEADEKLNIESRQSLIKQYQYLIHVINSDIVAYTRFAVLKRLGIHEDTNYVLSNDNSYLTIGRDDEPNPAKK